MHRVFLYGARRKIFPLDLLENFGLTLNKLKSSAITVCIYSKCVNIKLAI